MTAETQKRIRNFYGRDSVIVPPPIDLRKFQVSDLQGDYYLIVSRLEPYKKVDLAVEAFNLFKALSYCEVFGTTQNGNCAKC